MFGASLLHGVMFLKVSLHSLKRKRGVGGGGGMGAPHLQTQRLYDGFWEGPYMGFCLCWQDDARSDLAQLNKT